MTSTLPDDLGKRDGWVRIDCVTVVELSYKYSHELHFIYARSQYIYDLYVFNDQMVQGYRGVNINSRHNEESLGEMYRKDDIDVSNQEHTAPVYFQSLSLD